MESSSNISSSTAHTSLGLLDEHLLEGKMNSHKLKLKENLINFYVKESYFKISSTSHEQPAAAEPICINDTEIKELGNGFSRFSDANDVTTSGDDGTDEQENKGELSSRFFKAQDLTSNDQDSLSITDQRSKLNTSSVLLANSSFNFTTTKVSVDEYFNRKLTFPSTFDVSNGDRSLVNFKKEMESNKNQVPQILHRDIDESQNSTLMETTNDNSFSFTINVSEHGEALIPKKSTEKSKFNLKVYFN
jgi:hypothetical protein